MQSKAATVKAYLDELPPDRRREILAVRKVVLQNLPKGYEEIMDFGMIAYVVPLERFPDTYNGHPLAIAALAAQRNYNSLYLMSVYGDKATSDWFHEAYKASGKKLDMGKSCVRFRRADDLPLDVIGQAIARVPLDRFVERVRDLSASRARRS